MKRWRGDDRGKMEYGVEREIRGTGKERNNYRIA